MNSFEIMSGQRVKFHFVSLSLSVALLIGGIELCGSYSALKVAPKQNLAI